MAIREMLDTKKRGLLVGVALAAVIFSGILFFFKSQGNISRNAAKAGIIKPLVTVQTVEPRDMLTRIVLSGQTVAAAQVDIAAKYAGRIAQVPVELGQAVSAGQVLAIQDMEDILLSIAQTEAAAWQARAESTAAKATYDAGYQQADADYQRNLANYQRYESLYHTGAISREALDAARQQMINAKAAFAALSEQVMAGGQPAVLESKQAALSRAEYSLRLLEQQRGDMVLRAPRAGIIGYRQVEPGEFVQAGQKLLTVVDNSNIYIDCQVSEQHAAHIRTGMRLESVIDSLGRHYPGTVIYISPASDSKTQAFTVRIALDQADAAIKSGMFAQARVDMMLRPHTLFVAKAAILQKSGKEYLFVVKGNNQVEQRLVKTGQRNDDSVEIVDGIGAGERVAVSNISRLKPDSFIEVDS
ncbi:efflux RND transporter periplasmic adaptor subunit [Sporomusa sp.]|uniref:efflux RND transporter periplasmic adaptor subunit n=1 Tax=Sporomusa sp. TaxID=2078658 RepID=UPI002CD29D12|nr:efflux RND transporter periplasmic adaptor subunit [Sporomusa sp.]HWR09200.1 efflux RND transporter periplasmic adaptor subunit [Sporomusa sp.]